MYQLTINVVAFHHDALYTSDFLQNTVFEVMLTVMRVAWCWKILSHDLTVESTYTVKPVCNDHLYNEIYYLWFIQ